MTQRASHACGIALNGAPDSLIGTTEARTRAVQVMQLEMTRGVLDELLECARNRHAPHIFFGRTPTLRYNGKSQVLDTATEKFRHELYQSNGPDSGKAWAFSGLIHHKLSVRGVEDVTASVDTALETLKNNLATMNQEKEARGTIITNELSPIPGKRGSAKSQRYNVLLKKPSLSGSVAKSSPSSPAQSAFGSPSLTTAPTSAPTMQTHDMATQKALRSPLIHLLAIRPATKEELLKKTRSKKIICTHVLERIATEINNSQSGTKEWQLNEKAYKELNVWEFRYPSQQARQSAIDNAVRAYDRLRLGRDDKLWQLLLPREERGKGKVLSRLNLEQGPMQKTLTPAMKPKAIDRKTGLPKRTEPKRAVKDGQVKSGDRKTPKVEEDGARVKEPLNHDKGLIRENLTEKAVKSQGSQISHTSEGRTPTTKPARLSEPRGLEKPSSASSKKVINNKPKNPSPLSASPPVNASDFEDDHPVHKALSASASPAKPSNLNSDKSLKRKANDLDHDIHKHDVMPKQRKLQRNSGSSTISKSSNTPNSQGSRKRTSNDMDSDTSKQDSTPSKQRKFASLAEQQQKQPSSQTHYGSAYPNGTSPPDSDASNSPPLTLSWRQTVELAQKFKVYYGRYEKLYDQLASNPDPPSEQQREELMKMHRKLEEMKREINSGALRQ